MTRFFTSCVFGLLAAAFIVPDALPAAPVINFNGTFTNDNDVRLYSFVMSAEATVQIETVSYGTGGFDPLLTLFSGSGLSAEVIEFNDDAGCLILASCLDARIVRTLEPGLYILAVTQAGNVSFGALADGFLYKDNPLYTTTLYPAGNLATPFWDAEGNQRTGNWAVNFLGENARFLEVSGVPEPRSFLLLGSGALLLGCSRRRLKDKLPPRA